jgi:PilZ domain
VDHRHQFEPLPGDASADSDAADRRRAARHACLARVWSISRKGITTDISADGLSFHTLDRFTPAERIDLCVNFDLTREPILHVVHTATVVWTTTADHGRAWRVGVKFLD